MLLIYSEETSTRLQYICKFIFEEVLHTTFSLTLHEDSFAAHSDAKINYSKKSIAGAYQIVPHSLLFETGVRYQEINCKGKDESLSFFNSENGDHPFDIFAAVFFLITRYEEYLPHEKDKRERYAHQNSTAYKNDFLRIPIVNVWIKGLAEKLKGFYPSLINQPPLGLGAADAVSGSHFQPTYDIDMAWSYKEKGFLRNSFGFIRQPSLDRISTLVFAKKDPFDSFDILDELHQRAGLKPLYFFLVAKQNGLYDKNILPDNDAMQALIRRHATKYDIGLHPSWKSNEHDELLPEEKATLENISGKQITASRQHYIKMEFPQTYQKLAAAAITDDYSMGYSTENGFRASTASAFSWYDLSAEKITALRIHPFCFMDATCFYEKKLSTTEAYNELIYFYKYCKNVQSTMTTIFHNNFLGTDRSFAGWRELYEKFIAQLH